MKSSQLFFSPKGDFSTSLLWVVPLVNHGRARHLDALDDLPPVFQQTATRHFSQRLSQCESRPHIGEYLPWLLADVMGIPRSKKLDQTISGWLSLYFSLLLLDDLLDGSIRHSPNHMLTVAILQQRGLTQMLATSPKPLELGRCVDMAFDKAAIAARHEMDRRCGNVVPFKKSEIADLCDKGALLTICAEALALLSGHPNDSRKVITAFLRPLLTALQLLDDITDCAEDFQIGAATLPLTLHAKARNCSALPRKSNSDELLSSMILDGSLADSIQTAISFLRDAVRLTQTHHLLSETKIQNYTADLTDRANEALGIVTECRNQLQREIKIAAIDSPEFSRLVNETKRRLVIIMQTT